MSVYRTYWRSKLIIAGNEIRSIRHESRLKIVVVTTWFLLFLVVGWWLFIKGFQFLHDFPVGDLLDNGLAVESLVEPIKERLAPETWSDAGGPGVLHFDQLSRCLIVLQSQQTQFSIEILLGGVRAKLRPKPEAQPAEQ